MCESIVSTVNESWDDEAEARLTAKAIAVRLRNFQQLVEPATPTKGVSGLSKESGFLSLQESRGQSLSTCPPSNSDSYDSSITVSPSDVKPMNDFSSPAKGFSPPPPDANLLGSTSSETVDHLLPGGRTVSNGRPWSYGEMMITDDSAHLPPYQQKDSALSQSLPHIETNV